MALHATRIGILALCLIGIQVYVIGLLSSALANEESARSPWSFLEQHRVQIRQLSSDDEALAFFQSLLKAEGKSLQTRTTSPSSPVNPDVSEEIKEAMTTNLASLAAIAHVQAIRKRILGPATGNSQSSEEDMEAAQIEWIIGKAPFQTLKPMMDYYNVVSQWFKTAPQIPPSGNNFVNFASYYDQTYPEWDESPGSWASIFRQHGEKGIEARLLEYWQTSDQLAIQGSIPQDTHQLFAQHYIDTRLLPMFRANLLTHINSLEATAYETAWETWHHIQQWRQQELTESATTRLCGSWRWVVHNHQNHGDRKMTLTFAHPDQSPPSHIAPTTMAIHGDTVYLKWIFPQGVQEDSLLLSNNDTHLEGTFKNSLGPYGSISGKRLSTCRS